MTAFAALNGLPIDKLHIVIPALGMWHADASLTSGDSAIGPQVLQLSGSTWNCSPIRFANFAGSGIDVRLIGGAGGWRKTVAAQQYSSRAGVPTVTVLGDAAGLVGELPPVLDVSVPATVGTGYVRQSGAASLVLADLQSRGVFQWWMDPSGVVQTKPRPSTRIASRFVAEEVEGASGWYRIATEFPGDWMPGAQFSSVTVSGTVNRVEHRIDRGHLWSEVLVA